MSNQSHTQHPDPHHSSPTATTKSEEHKAKLRALASVRFQEQIKRMGVQDIAIEAGIEVVTKVDVELEKFITSDAELKQVKSLVKKFAPTNIPVLIVGETGTGKELIARALHGERTGHFVGVNCGGIPDTLLEAEFFGCVSGAFTGAVQRAGYIEEANNGTLFLDEIGEMPRMLQSKLLRVLQEQRFRRIGSTKELVLSCRVVSATNRDVTDRKEFREDLFYRLAGTILNLKPLANRQDDIELIVRKYLHNDEEIIKVFMDGIKTLLPLKGNVRQLINLIQEFKVINNIV